MEKTTFGYSRRQFFLNLFLLALLATVAPLLLLSSVAIDLWAVLLIILLAALVLVLGVSPLLTSHEIGSEHIVLRQGLYFTGKIALSDIHEVERIFTGPRRTGVFFRILHSTLYVTTRRNDLIEVRLKRPQRFGWALGKMAERVVFDTENNTKFLAHLESLTGLIPANQDQWF